MKKIFITSKGNIELDRNVLFIKNRKFIFHETGFAKAWVLLPPVLLVANFFITTQPFQFYVRTVLYSIWSVLFFPSIYKLLFKTSFSKRIPVEKIGSIETKENPNGLEVEVLLHLKNNRVRSVVFRKLEKQYEEFIETLSFQISTMSIA